MVDVGAVGAGREQCRHQVRRELAHAAAALEHAVGRQPLAEGGRRVDPAQSEPRRQRLGEGAQPDDGRRRVQRAQRRRRLARVGELAVHVVLDEHEVLAPRQLEQAQAARRGQTHAGRVVVGRDGVEQARAPSRRPDLADGRVQRVHVETLRVQRHADDVHRVVGDDAQRQVVGRALDEDHVAGVGEQGHDLAEGLRVAAAHQHVVRRRARGPRVRRRARRWPRGAPPVRGWSRRRAPRRLRRRAPSPRPRGRARPAAARGRAPRRRTRRSPRAACSG